MAVETRGVIEENIEESNRGLEEDSFAKKRLREYYITVRKMEKIFNELAGGEDNEITTLNIYNCNEKGEQWQNLDEKRGNLRINPRKIREDSWHEFSYFDYLKCYVAERKYENMVNRINKYGIS